MRKILVAENLIKHFLVKNRASNINKTTSTYKNHFPESLFSFIPYPAKLNKEFRYEDFKHKYE